MRQWAGIKEQDEAFERVLGFQERSGPMIPVSLQQEEEGLVFRVPDLLVPMLSEIRTHRLSSGQVAGRPEGACASVQVRGGLAAHCCCFRMDAARVVWSSSEQRVRQKCRVAASTLVASVAGRCGMGVRTVFTPGVFLRERLLFSTLLATGAYE